ncbi:MAG: endolytic transglycosylase MltG [Saprospiraceae bacterium]|nr:endolytic transglycosylase MltG [Bacteroidia bacterium]NNE15428.1 endolytic transglycosylase MltG [Saprospiraceae bacterium]NNL93553.1 endolytic transglycosylase MltG [Saprospiraceae bacterium]
MKKKLFLLLLILIVAGAAIGFKFYQDIFLPNVNLDEENTVIHIPTSSTIDAVVDTLTERNIIKEKDSFLWVADIMKYKSPKPGRYRINNNWSNKELISHLRSGRQEAINLTFNNVRTIDDLAALFSEELEASKDAFLNHFTSKEVLFEYGQTKESVLSLFIPNTYQIYWNVTPASLMSKLHKEYKKFWNKERTEKIKEIGLTKEEVYTMASIVQKESNLKKEKPIIAGIYLNRIKKGMLLQADPTVIFGVGDFEIRRVLNKHLAYDSPYNTYKYTGLPPGPICMPDISSIDAVINAEDHDYLYFCVSPGTGFEHAFAKTLKQHNRNAQRYRKWLNSQKIYE